MRKYLFRRVPATPCVAAATPASPCESDIRGASTFDAADSCGPPASPQPQTPAASLARSSRSLPPLGVWADVEDSDTEVPTLHPVPLIGLDCSLHGSDDLVCEPCHPSYGVADAAGASSSGDKDGINGCAVPADDCASDGEYAVREDGVLSEPPDDEPLGGEGLFGLLKFGLSEEQAYELMSASLVRLINGQLEVICSHRECPLEESQDIFAASARQFYERFPQAPRRPTVLEWNDLVCTWQIRFLNGALPPAPPHGG